MIYVVCGKPLAGKSTIIAAIKAIKSIAWFDKDHVRDWIFGNPGTVNDTLTGVFDKESQACYRILFQVAEEFLGLERDLIISGPFVREKNQKMLYGFLDRHEWRVKVMECRLMTETEQEIAKRLDSRNKDPHYAGGLRTLEEYQRIEYTPLSCHHYLLDTSPPKSVEQSVDEAMECLFEN